MFELKDRLIRDEEFDGWKEIPLKRDNLWVWSGPDIFLPGISDAVNLFSSILSFSPLLIAFWHSSWQNKTASRESGNELANTI